MWTQHLGFLNWRNGFYIVFYLEEHKLCWQRSDGEVRPNCFQQRFSKRANTCPVCTWTVIWCVFSRAFEWTENLSDMVLKQKNKKMLFSSRLRLQSCLLWMKPVFKLEFSYHHTLDPSQVSNRVKTCSQRQTFLYHSGQTAGSHWSQKISLKIQTAAG